MGAIGRLHLAVAWGLLLMVNTAMGSVIVTRADTGHEYQLTTTSNTWTGAQAEAVSAGGTLVVINDLAEENWLKSKFFGPEMEPTWDGKWIFWMGLTDYDRTAGDFHWVDGSPLSYTNWRPPANPDHLGTERYVQMFTGWYWDNRTNDNQVLGGSQLVYGLIERGGLPLVPEPSSVILGVLGFGAVVVGCRRGRRAG